MAISARSLFHGIRGREPKSPATRLFLAGIALAVLGLCGPSSYAQGRFDFEAYSGSPFGVGRITLQSGGDFRINRVPGVGRGRIADLAKRIIDPSGKEQPMHLESGELSLVERAGRVFYPVFEKRDRPILREFVDVPTQTAILFLFQGNAPLDLTAYMPAAQTGQIIPRQDPAGHARLLRDWWRDYSAAATGNVSREYPPLVEEYLTDMLARRLRLPLPSRADSRQSGWLQSELNALLENETARLEIAQSILLDDVGQEAASQLLPEELPAPAPESLTPPVDTPIETIALHVPAECLYVRFGSFPNFLWLRHRMEDWGGELRDVVSERGLNFGLSDRMQRQLGMRESALAELLGEKVIADVALIGTDVFLREGAAIGMLFQAKSNSALAADLTQQRLTAAKEDKQAKSEKLRIAGHDVSFVSTPTNSLRSFYVADGDFHLVTTSRTIVERFLAVGARQQESLGASPEFRQARTRLPLSRGDAVFVYLAPTFFQNLLSPRYQIELDRRLRASVEMELFPIAQLAARSEGKPGATPEELSASGMLSQGFGHRSDGSHLALVDGVWVDSLRGGRGSFVPVPDVPIEKVTPAEAADYRRFAADYTAAWGPMDPVVVAIQRETLPGGKLERVVLEAEAAPLSPKHVAILDQWLGPPTDQRLAPIPGDVVALEAVLRGGTFFSGGDHHLFGALRDADPALAMDPRTSLMARVFAWQLQGLQGYVGAWPNPGFLTLFGGNSNAPPDAAGYSQLLTGMWRRQFDRFTLMSFHPEVLELASAQLKFERAERPAQVWFRAEDLAQSKLAPMLNAYGYRQARQVTQGNLRFMNMLSDQLHVPAAEGRATAERLLNAKFEAPLGGKYELSAPGTGHQTWGSTALAGPGNAKQPPADYQFPALNWLRGIEFEMRAQNGMLAAHGEFVMPVETRPGFQLPALPFGLTPGGSAKPTDKKAAPPAPQKPRLAPAPSGAKPAGKREF